MDSFWIRGTLHAFCRSVCAKYVFKGLWKLFGSIQLKLFFFSQEARKIIRDHDKSTPLFLYLPLMSIHSPHVGLPPQRFRNLYNRRENSGFESPHELRDIVLAAVDYAIHKVFVDLKMYGMYCCIGFKVLVQILHITKVYKS